MSEIPLQLNGINPDAHVPRCLALCPLALQGLLEIKDTHRPRVLQQADAEEQRTNLGAVRAPNFE